ncbi:MAG: SCO family protein, partial [Candidatus Angelobacter sp.]
ITQPDKMLEAKDPIASALYKHFNGVNMPNLSLTEKDADSLIKFINARTSELSARETAPSGPATGTALSPR